MINFDGKYVWITGAGRGIGYQIACHFHHLGATVIGFDLEFENELTPFIKYRLDLSDHKNVSLCCQEILSSLPQLDILITCAGILITGKTEELTWHDLQRSFNVNVGRLLIFFKLFFHYFSNKKGCIVAICSNAAHVPRIGISLYCAPKAALHILCQTVGLELTPYGIRSNLVSPGLTDTFMLNNLWNSNSSKSQTIHSSPSEFRLGIPSNKIESTKEIADTVVFLSSEFASHITLLDIIVNGGATLGI